MRLHDLRHTHGSIAVKAGVPIGVVSERLGHARPEFTLHRYAHAMPGCNVRRPTLLPGLSFTVESLTSRLTGVVGEELVDVLQGRRGSQRPSVPADDPSRGFRSRQPVATR